MANINFDNNIIKRYDGSQDIDIWLVQFDCYCKINEIPKNMQPKVIRLLLTNRAAEKFEFLSNETKDDIDKIKTELKRLFITNPIKTWMSFKDRQLEPEERVISFLMDLRRMGSMMGGVPDDIIKYAFVSGLPSEMARMLCSTTNFETISVQELMDKAPLMDSFSNKVKTTRPKTEKPQIQCYKCGKNGHIAKRCRY